VKLICGSYRTPISSILITDKYISDFISLFIDLTNSIMVSKLQSSFLIIFAPPFREIILCLFLKFYNHPLLNLQLTDGSI
jgi:hypothetical protein